MQRRPKAGDRARRQVHEAWKDAAVANWRALILQAFAFAGVGVLNAFLPTWQWLRSYLFGILTATALASLVWVVHIASGMHGRQLGRMGEECTARAVDTWWRRRKGWATVHGLYFHGNGDVDHVLIGPGGVFAIESKWVSNPCTVSQLAITGIAGRDPVVQAQDGAAKIQNLLRYGRNRQPVEVTPVVVLWGPGTPSIDGGFRYIRDTLVCEGRQQRRWLIELKRHGTMDTQSIDRATSTLLDQRTHQLDAATTKV